MADLDNFRKRVQELCRRSSPYEGRRATQRDLADAVGLSASELSSRLNGSSGAHLAPRDVRAVVRALAEWGAIQTQAEAGELLAMMDCPSFSAAEWAAPPLDLLTAPAPPPPLPTPPTPPAPSLHSLPTTNLPAPLSSFIGRERELATAEANLADNRLLTLVGAGGTGKTRLAVEVARRMLIRYREVWLVELASLRDPDLLPQAIANTVGVREQPGETLTDTLLAALHGRDMLLVVDNCEHLVAAVANLTHRLLRGCPYLRVLATSRERLRVAGEVVMTVPPLGLPSDSSVSMEELMRYEAPHLFITRAQAVAPGFQPSDTHVAAVAEVCRRLDGIPLAIELAAARVRVLSVESIAARLSDSFQLLTGGERTALPHQQTLAALIDWSYGLLDDAERRLLRWLSVFATPFPFSAVEAVCAPLGDSYTLVELLTQLVDKSLLIAVPSGDEVCYRMLETIRSYAATKLVDSGEADAACHQHLAYCCALAEAAEPLLTGAEQATWLNRLEQQHEDIRAALRYAIERDNGNAAVRLAGSLWRFWLAHGHLSEGRKWLEQVLKLDSADISLRAKALNGCGNLALYQGDYTAARPLYQAALDLRRQLGDQQGVASSIANLGVVAMNQGDYAAARALYQEGLAIDRQLGDNWGIARSLNNLGIIARLEADYMAARALYKESLATFQQLSDTRDIAHILTDLGGIDIIAGDYALAATALRDAATMFEQLGEKEGSADVLTAQGQLAYRQGDYPTARRLLAASLELRRELGDRQGVAYSLEGFAGLAVAKGELARATSLYAAATALRDQLGAPLPPGERIGYDHDLATCRATLPPAQFATAWQDGLALDWEQAADIALSFEF